MPGHLVLSFAFLSPYFHGRRDRNEPEWPPSPLRVFQALVASAARAGSLSASRVAFEWLERQPAPAILSPRAKVPDVGYRLSVPHNAMDLVARQWVAGKEGSSAEHRTMKEVRAHRLLVSDDPTGGHAAPVRYVWPLTSTDDAQVAHRLASIAKSVVALGWGVDLVVGDGDTVDDSALRTLVHDAAVVWQPSPDSTVELRTAVPGTLQTLEMRHAAAAVRTTLERSTITPPPLAATFSRVGYAPTGESCRPPTAMFALLDPGSDSTRAFDTARRGMVVAGMVRNALRLAAERAGWPSERVATTVLGHGDGALPRFLLVPVPSIETRGTRGEVVTAIRRVLILSTDAHAADIAWARRALGGVDLVDQQTSRPTAILSVAPPSDATFKRYCGTCSHWSTVTPVVLPGLDDPGGLRKRLRAGANATEQKELLTRLANRREGLVRKALRHAGFADALVFAAQIEIREIGFLAGTEPVRMYAVPQHLAAFPRFHVRLTWPKPITGPICVGRGRFSGLGLFAPMTTAGVAD